MLKTTANKVLSLVAVVLLSSGGMAFADEFAVVDGIRYKLTSNYATVVVNSAAMEKYSGDVVIPEKFLYNNSKYTVRYVEFAFRFCPDLTSVTLPKTIEVVDLGSFVGSPLLSAINVAEGNEYLKSVDGVLYACPDFMRAHYRLDAVPGKFAGTFTVPEWVGEIAKYAFSHCEGITEIKMPPSVKVIGEGAFSDCSTLERVNIPDGVENIGELMFSNCKSLKSLQLPQTVTAIEENAFWECSSLVSVNLPEGLTRIGNMAFGNCVSLASIQIPTTLGSVPQALFQNCESLEVIDIPYGVYSIKKSAFYGCRSLEKVVIANSVRSVDENVFMGCDKLMEVYVSWDYQNIPRNSGHVFDDNTYLNATLYIPRGEINSYEHCKPWQNFFNIEEYDYAGIDNVNVGEDAEIAVKDGVIFVNANGAVCKVYDFGGKLVAETGEGVVRGLASGAYVVAVGGKTVRVMVP